MTHDLWRLTLFQPRFVLRRGESKRPGATVQHYRLEGWSATSRGEKMRCSGSRIVTFDTSDGLRMKGFLAVGCANRATIVHVHGSCGNFYENNFISVMAEEYAAGGVNFLSANNRGHDCMTEAYRHGELVYIGGSYEDLDECVLDIEAAVRFAEDLGSPIILQGHSLGCLKVLIYLLQSRRVLDFVLLSPSDTCQLQLNYICPETLEEQVSRIRQQYADHMDALLAPHEFGVRQKGLEYHIPATAGTLVSLLSSRLLRLLSYREPTDYHLQSQAFVYYGGSDPLWTEAPETVEQFFRKRATAARFLYCQTGDHHFRSLERFVAREILEWILARRLPGHGAVAH